MGISALISPSPVCLLYFLEDLPFCLDWQVCIFVNISKKSTSVFGWYLTFKVYLINEWLEFKWAKFAFIMMSHFSRNWPLWRQFFRNSDCLQISSLAVISNYLKLNKITVNVNLLPGPCICTFLYNPLHVV